jgi:UrcA family protein
MNIKTCLCHWTLDPKTLLAALTLAGTLAGVTDSVLANPPPEAAEAESIAATVSLADLDVSTPEGVRAASARLAKVAQRLCRKLGDNRRVSDWATYADCCQETLAKALRQVKPVVADLPRPNQAQH